MRLPNTFVDRYSTDSRAQIEQIARLMDGLGPRDGVLIYPEGTRPTTPERRARALERLREKNPALAPRFDDVATLGALVNGALIDRVIRVRFWRVPFDEIPKTREERLEWLFEEWGELDRWVTPLRRQRQEAS